MIAPASSRWVRTTSHPRAVWHLASPASWSALKLVTRCHGKVLESARCEQEATRPDGDACGLCLHMIGACDPRTCWNCSEELRVGVRLARIAALEGAPA